MLKKDISTSSAGDELLKNFGPILVINLPFRQDRRKEFAQTLKGIGLGFDHPDINLFEAFRPTDKGGFPSIGARGCFLSHLGAIETAIEKGWKSILICEDDLDFSIDFAKRSPECFRELETAPWDIVYFGHGDFVGSVQLSEICSIAEVPPETEVVCAHFMAIRGDAIGDLVEYLKRMLSRKPGDPEGGPMHVDGAYSWFRRENPQYRTFVAVPPLGHQRPSRTDIHALKLYDRLPIIKSLVGLLRKNRRNS